jgi:hypothetical protein
MILITILAKTLDAWMQQMNLIVAPSAPKQPIATISLSPLAGTVG